MNRSVEKELPPGINNDFLRGMTWENMRQITMAILRDPEITKGAKISDGDVHKLARRSANAILAIWDANPRNRDSVAKKELRELKAFTFALVRKCNKTAG